ncbi:peptidylprolyl isomerase [Glaciecola sp. XM2]|uniref:peptidylprolyl isomerase n=1 Tax=Glaciecola sp. XM2 TaxID=1914931 RepID=UPI001BDF1D6C|nr:peptidylprolyl isomerase [Glaciecola sp. XM2]MBT1450765.1 peptidylprolyl isomerase [Glaciecola sp. XM2]
MKTPLAVVTLSVLLSGCEPQVNSAVVSDNSPSSLEKEDVSIDNEAQIGAQLSAYTSSAALIDSLNDNAWRQLEPENTIVMTLPNGEVIIELAQQFAPIHVTNIKTLVSEQYYDGNRVIRSHDNYVAQWGEISELSPDYQDVELKSIGSAKDKVEVEFYAQSTPSSFQPIVSRDAYADQVGFTDGLPTAKNNRGHYLTHCYGMVGVSRGNESNSGNGTGLYAVTGHAPRHLDLNVTLVGKVWQGIEHLSSLPRGTQALGFYGTIEETTPIESVRFLEEGRVIEVMKTDTPEFARYVELRATRNEDWFIEPTGKIELCNVAVPVR